jgi:hypothetical protein
MEIVFTALFDDYCRDKFHIPRQLVRDAITNPLELHSTSYKGLKLNFYTKDIVGDELLLIIAREDNSKLVIDYTFRIKADLLKATDLQNPLTILQKFIERFGLNVVVGEQKSKFIFEEEINIQPNNAQNILNIENPNNHSFITSSFIKIDNSKTKIECAMVFALDVNDYQEWLDN